MTVSAIQKKGPGPIGEIGKTPGTLKPAIENLAQAMDASSGYELNVPRKEGVLKGMKTPDSTPSKATNMSERLGRLGQGKEAHAAAMDASGGYELTTRAKPELGASALKLIEKISEQALSKTVNEERRALLLPQAPSSEKK